VGRGTGDAPPPSGRTREDEVTVFKSLGLAVEDVTAADLAYRRAVERGIGMEFSL
jgi:alanine dehydrogenase